MTKAERYALARYEGLSDAEACGSVGWRPGAASAQARALWVDVRRVAHGQRDLLLPTITSALRDWRAKEAKLSKALKDTAACIRVGELLTRHHEGRYASEPESDLSEE